MALFKILKGESVNLTEQPIHEGYCYVTTDEHMMYIDTETERFALNAEIAKSASGLHNAYQHELTPTEFFNLVSNFMPEYGFKTYTMTGYFDTEINGDPVTAMVTTYIDKNNDVIWQVLDNTQAARQNHKAPDQYIRTMTSSTSWSNWEPKKFKLDPAGNETTPIYINNSGDAVPTERFLPLIAGENNKLTGPLGLTEGVGYGATLPEEGFEGQLFFLEDIEYSLPLGGAKGEVLIKNSNTDGDSYWGKIQTLPSGGIVGQALIKKSEKEGDAEWREIVALPKGGTAGELLVKYSENDGEAEWTDTIASLQVSGAVNIGGTTVVNGLSASQLNVSGPVSFANNLTVGGTITGSKVYGAVYNDYAEFREQKELIEPGYCVASTDNGQVYKTTEKFQACDGIVSDTFGFAIGETNDSRTPLAVAGRVLAYCEGNREDYHSGDTVCAGPDGKVCKMTREEIREWPDRIIGIVSEIPNYETWGSNNTIVNGRIWIKVR